MKNARNLLVCGEVWCPWSSISNCPRFPGELSNIPNERREADGASPSGAVDDLGHSNFEQTHRREEGLLIVPHSAASPVAVMTKVATRLFSGQELSALRRDASFRRQIEEGLVMEVKPSTPTLTTGARATARQNEGMDGRGGAAGGGSGGGSGGPKGDPIAGGLKDRNPREWSEVSWKSVSLARKERDRRACNGKEGQGAPSLLDSGESKKKDVGTGKGAADRTVGGGAEAKEGRKRSLQETESSAMRQHARKREDEFIAGGAQNFYKPVRVCGSCFRVRKR